MRIFGWKIPKGNIFLFISFMAVSLCVSAVVSAIRAERLVSLSRNGLYTGHQKLFSVSSSEDEERWEDVIPELAAKYDHFSICLPVKNPDFILRGIYIKGTVYSPPMLSGQYFDESTSWADTHRMVVGKDYEKDVYTRGGARYYAYENEEYEVAGVMGTEGDSRINHMILMDFKSAVRLAGINTEYVLDTMEQTDIYDIGQELYNGFEYPAELSIVLNQKTEEPLLLRALSGGQIVRTTYVVILTGFSLSTVLVTVIWMRFRRRLFFAWNLCGYKICSELMETAKRYYKIAGTGFVAGTGLMYSVSCVLPDMRLKFADAVTSFVITLCFGTVVLAVCFVYNNGRLFRRSQTAQK